MHPLLENREVGAQLSGDVQVYTTGSLTVTVSGAGDVVYTGNPSTVETNVSGAGQPRVVAEEPNRDTQVRIPWPSPGCASVLERTRQSLGTPQARAVSGSRRCVTASAAGHALSGRTHNYRLASAPAEGPLAP